MAAVAPFSLHQCWREKLVQPQITSACTLGVYDAWSRQGEVIWSPLSHSLSGAQHITFLPHPAAVSHE